MKREDGMSDFKIQQASNNGSCKMQAARLQSLHLIGRLRFSKHIIDTVTSTYRLGWLKQMKKVMIDVTDFR